VTVPPLRERREDIPAVVEHLLGGPVSDRFAPGVLAALERYPWPGNYDELFEEVERLLRTGYGRIEVGHIRRDIVSYQETAVNADPEILQVLREIEECIEAFQVAEGMALDFAPYFWRGGPVPEAPGDPCDMDCDYDHDPWEKDLAW
jgi:DNA-binding NtrC family response regulator